MHRLSLITLACLLMALPFIGQGRITAQDDAADRIRRAYDAHAEWATYHVDASGAADYALTAQSARDAIWQKQAYNLALSGWYDQGDPDRAMTSLALTSRIVKSDNEQVDGVTQDLTLDLARIGDEMFWRGTYEGAPSDSFTVPDEWSPFDVARDTTAPPLRHLPLSRYLLAEDADPFVDDYAAWLEAADAITGPRDFRLNRSLTGDLYVITLPLSAAPELLSRTFDMLFAGAARIIEPDTLRDRLGEQGSVTWGVVLDPDRSTLLAQFIQLDLSTELRGDDLQEPFTALSIALSAELNTLFSAVNEPVDTSSLPEQPS